MNKPNPFLFLFRYEVSTGNCRPVTYNEQLSASIDSDCLEHPLVSSSILLATQTFTKVKGEHTDND